MIVFISTADILKQKDLYSTIQSENFLNYMISIKKYNLPHEYYDLCVCYVLIE